MRLADGEIVLRPRTEDDVPAITAACQDPEIARWTPVPSPYTEDDAREFLRSAADANAIVDAHTGEFLGTIGWRWVDANIQVGYWVKRDARDRGVATRALCLLSRWAIEFLGAGRVQLITDPENVASQRVAERAGFTREATLRSYFELKGRRRDAVMYSLLPGDVAQPCRPKWGPICQNRRAQGTTTREREHEQTFYGLPCPARHPRADGTADGDRSGEGEG